MSPAGDDRSSGAGAVQEAAGLPFERGFRLTPASVIVVEPTTERIINVSEGFVRMFGFSPQELVGHTISEMGLWPRANPAVCASPNFLMTLSETEARWCKRSGEFVSVRLTCDSIEYAGKPHVVCLVREEHLHPQVRAEQEAHSRQDVLFSRVYAAVALGEVVQPEESVKLEMNERFRTLVEADESLSPHQQWDLLCEMMPPLAQAKARLTFPGNSSFPDNWLPNLGKILDLHVSHLMDGYFVITAEDVTDRRRNEDALLRLNEQLRVRMQYKKALVEGLLGSNEAFLYALSERMQNHLDALASVEDTLSPEAREAVHQLFACSAQVMRYASARFMSYRRALVDTGKVVEQLVLDFHRKFPNVLFTCTSMAQVTAAEQPLEAILHNLIMALVKLAPEGEPMQLSIGVQSEFLESMFVLEAQAPDGAPPFGPPEASRLPQEVEYCVAQRITLLHGGTMKTVAEDGAVICRFTLGTPVVSESGSALRS